MLVKRLSLAVLLVSFHFADAKTPVDTNLKACVEAVCGPFDPQQNAAFRLQKYEKNNGGPFESTIQNQLKPLLQRWIDNEYHILETTNEFLKKFKDLDQIKLTDSESKLVNIFKIAKLILEYMEYFELNHIPYSLNQEKFLAAPDEIKTKLKTAEKLFATKAYQKYARMAGLPAWARYAVEYPELDFDQALALDLRSLQSVNNSLAHRFPSIKSMFLNSPLINAVKIGGMKNLDTANDYFPLRFAREVYLEILTSGAFATELSKPVDFKASVTSTGALPHLLEERRINLLPDVKKLEIEQTLKICEQKLRAAYYASPTYQEIQKYNESIEVLKKHAAILLSQISDLSMEQANEKMKEVRFHLPSRQKEMKQNLENSIRVELNESLQRQEDLTPLDMANPTLQTKLVLVLMTRDALGHKTGLQDVKDFCKSLKPEPLPVDFSLIGKNRISTSWYSLRFKEAGLAIAGHELGHAIMDAGTINESIKQCLKTFNSERNNAHYYQEDFADAFGARLLIMMDKENDIKRSWRHNFSCPWTGGVGSGYDFKNISLKNSDDSDTHSSHFFRALHQESYFSQLPKTCENVIQAHDKNLSFSQCL